MPSTSLETFLVTRLSHIGDCVLTLPMVNSLRDARPQARIAWVVEPPGDQILRGHRAIDLLIVAERGWRRSLSKAARLRRRLLETRPTVVLDPQGLTKSSLLGWLSGGVERIGFTRPMAGELAPWLYTRSVPAASRHLADRSRELLAALDIPPTPARFDLPVDPRGEERAEEIVRSHFLTQGFVVLNPGASWHSKRWPTASFAQLARQLGQTHQVPTLVTWAGDEERRMAEEIRDRSGGFAALAPRTNLVELVSILRRARLYVGSDTGPMHLSAAVGTRCVALFGPTLPEASGPYGPGHRCLQAVYQSGSRRARRSGENWAMRQIAVDQVLDACEQILALSRCAIEQRDGVRAA